MTYKWKEFIISLVNKVNKTMDPIDLYWLTKLYFHENQEITL